VAGQNLRHTGAACLGDVVKASAATAIATPKLFVIRRVCSLPRRRLSTLSK
jgi:hypothetical protein